MDHKLWSILINLLFLTKASFGDLLRNQGFEKKHEISKKKGIYHFTRLQAEIVTQLTLLFYKQNCNPSVSLYQVTGRNCNLTHFACLKVEIATSLTLLVYKQNSNPSNLSYHFASLKVEIATSLTLLVCKQNSNPSNLSVSKS